MRGQRAAGDRDRPCPGRRGRRPGRPAGLGAGHARLRRRAGRHRPPLVRLVRGPGAGRTLPAGGRARGLAAGPGGPAGGGRTLGRRGRTAGRFAGTLPDGSTIESYLAMLRALLCRDGVDRMRADAQAALAGLSPASPWRPTALLLEGIGYLLDGRGRPGRSDPGPRGRGGHRGRGAARGRRSPWPSAPWWRCDRQDWEQAATLAEQALGDAAGRARWTTTSCSAARPRRGGPGGRAPGRRRRGPESSSPGPLACGRCSPTPCPTCAVQTLLELGRALPGPGRRRRRQGGPAPGPRHPPAATRPRASCPSQAEELRSKLDTSPRRGPGSVVAHHRRAAPAAAAAHPPDLRGDRRAAVPLPAHGQDPGDLGLPQARRLLAQPGRPAPRSSVLGA